MTLHHAKRGFSMPSWDVERREAIDLFYEGGIDEREALARIKAAKARAAAYRARRGWR